MSPNPLSLWIGAISVPGDVTVTPDALELALTFETPTVLISSSVSPDALELALTLETPTVSISGDVTVTPDPLELALTLETPTVSISGDVTVTPDALELALTLETPTVSISGDVTVTPDALELALTLETPTVSISGDVTVTPDALELALTLKTPTVLIPEITLTLNGTAGVTNVTPRFDFTSGTVKVYVEDVYIKDLTTGVEDNISLSEGEKLEYVCSDYNAITRIYINEDKVSGDVSGWTLPSTLTYFYINDTSISGDVSGWTLPSNLICFFVNDTSVSGDISGWTLPSNLTYFFVNNTSVSGDISGWTLPSVLIYFRADNTSVSGDVSGWTLLSNLAYFYINSTSISGDISGWTLPSNLIYFLVNNTSVSGDVSGWILPSGLTYFAAFSTSVSGNISGWTLPSNLIYFAIRDTSVLGDISGWTLPSTLTYFYVDYTSVSGDISGWTLPSGLILFAIYNTSVSGDISGWTLPSTLAYFYINSTSVSGDVSGWTLPSTLIYFYVYSTQLDYDSSSGAFTGITNNLNKIDFDNCTLSSAQVDNILVDCVTSEIEDKVLEVSGNNGSPTAAGLANKAILEVRNWTVTISPLNLVTPSVFALEATLLSSDALTGYPEIPPSILESLMDPYAGGAWLWLCEISIQGYERIRIARNTEDVVYCGITFFKSNFRLGLQSLTGDGSVPRVSLQVLQDRDYVLEDIINETQGAGGGTVKVIRTHEEFLTRFVKDLEANFDILTSESDTEWVTFTLGIPNPLMRRMPLRLNSSKRCPYALPGLFKGPDCQYAGSDSICTGTYDDCLTKDNAIHWGAEMGLDPNTIRV